MSNRQYLVGDKLYNVKPEHEEEFLQEHKNAEIKDQSDTKEYHVGPSGNTYRVKKEDFENFSYEHPDAKPLAGNVNSSANSANVELNPSTETNLSQNLDSEFASESILSDYQLNNSQQNLKKQYGPMPTVTAETVSQSEEKAIKELRDKYMEYGFTFEQKGLGVDRIEVTALNGESKKFWLGANVGGAGDANAASMDAWMKENQAEHQGSKLEGFLANVRVTQDQEGNIPKDQETAQTQITELREAWGLEGYSDTDVLKAYDSYTTAKTTDSNMRFDIKSPDTYNNWKNSNGYKDYLNKKEQLGGTSLDKDVKKNRTNLDVITNGKDAYKQEQALKLYEEKEGKGITDNMYDENGITDHGVKVLNSKSYKDIYASLKIDEKKEQEFLNTYFNKDQMGKYLDKNLKDQIEKFSDSAFVKSDTQKELVELAKDKQKNISNKTKEKTNKFNVVYGDLQTIYDERNKTADWLNSQGDGTDFSKSLEDKYDLTTQEGVDSYNAEIKQFQQEYKDKKDRYDFLQKKSDQYEKFAHKIGGELDDISDSDLKSVIGALERNYQQGTVMAAQLSNAVVELGQGVVNAGDWALSLPRQIIKEVDNPGVSAFFNVSSDVNPNAKTRGIDEWNDWLDGWQKQTFEDRIEKPTKFGDIDSLSSVGEWASGVVASQIPILASMYMTGGYSLYFMGATSTGSKFKQLQDSKKEYHRTGGLYGTDHGWGSMFMNAGFTGLTESLSEKITLGQVTKLKSIAKNSKAARLGWQKDLKTNVFTAKNFKSGATDVFEEGFSESVAQLSSNFLDMASGVKGANIWDGVVESFASGALISQGMKIPALGSMMSAPFRSAGTNQKVGENSEKITNLQKRAEGLDHNSPEFKEIESEIVSLVDQSISLIEQDVKRVGLFTNNEKKALINIEKQNHQARKKANDIKLNDKLTDKQKQEQLADLQAKVDMRYKTKSDILGKHKVNVIDANYEREMDYYKRQADLSNKRGDVKTNVKEVSDKEYGDIIAKDEGQKSKAAVDAAVLQKQAEIKALNKIIRDPKTDPAVKKDARQKIKEAKSQEGALNSILAETSDYGVMIPRFDNKNNLVAMDVIVNRDKALTDGALNTGAHEFLHAQFRTTLKGDPNARKNLGKHMMDIIQSGKMSFVGDSKNEYVARISQYNENQRGEEMFTVLSEMMRDGKVNINESTATKIGDYFKRWSKTYNSREIEFNTTEDIVKFIKDYDYNIRNNVLSPAMADMLQKGATGKIFKEAKDFKTRERMRSFDRAVDLNRRSNPDLKREYDQFVQNSDGTRKYDDHDMFKDSPDFHGAYLNIVEGRALDGLIQQGMTERGLPPEALREFTRAAKEEVGRRFIENYDNDKNDSLFGWLTGVSGGAGMSIIYRAKGDVMVQYKKDNKAQQTSIDKQIGEGTKLSDVLQDERDSLLEEIDNEDLSINRRKAAKENVRDNKVKEMLNFSDNARQSIMDNIREVDMPFDGLTYKGVKDLLVSARKATSEKIVQPDGPLFPVLNAVATEFGIDPLRILAKQDLNAEQRQSAQSYILQKTTNEDGSFNRDLIDMLPEGETRSGEATGIANTKLGQLYEAGSRLKVSEGADKGLGQKKSQIKRSNVSKAEFLNIFGIEPNGRLKKGTKADGAIRALVVATAQIAANQDARINALTNGTATEAMAARLADGRGERMFSKKVKPENINIFEQRWSEAISGLDDITMYDWRSIRGHLVNVYGDVMSPKEISGMAKDWAKWNQEFDNLKLPDNIEVVENLDYYNRETYIISKTNEALLDTNILKLLGPNFSSPVASITDLFKSKERVNKARGSIVDFSNHAINELGWSDEKLIRVLFTQYQGMYASASKIGDGRWTTKLGRVVANSLPIGQDKWGTNRGQVFENVNDFISTLSKVNGFKSIKGKTRNEIGKMYGVNLNTFKETSDAAIKDKDYEGRLNQAKEAREAVSELVDFYTKRIFDGQMQFEDLAMLTRMFGSQMSSPMKRAANLAYIAEGAESIPSKQRGKKLEYEHMVPTNLKILQLVQSYVNNGGIENDFWNDYTVAIIPKTMDKVLIDSGLRDFMQLGYQPGTAQWKRYYNNQTFGKKGIVPIKNIQTGDIIGQEFVKASNKFVDKTKQDIIQRTNSQRMQSKAIPEPKGMSAFDFDETLIIDGDNFIIATNPQTNETERISSEDWPTRGTELMEQGYDFNFDDFINVRGGVEGPLFKKLKNRIEKFGPENNFILTARPQEAAIAIHGWLESKGINIPLQNITGLSSSLGDAKAQWMLDKYQEGYNDMYFVDDATPNVVAVKHVMDQLDVKGSSVQVNLDNAGKKIEVNNESMKSKVIDSGNPINKEFNDMLERDSGIKSGKIITDSEAKKSKGGESLFQKFFVPPSAEDFKGLLYKFLGKGKQGNKDLAFFKKVLLDPFAKGIKAYNNYRQSMANDYAELQKTMPNVVKNLNNTIEDTNFTTEDAIRAYLWNKAGFEVPGLSQEQLQQLVEHVEADPDLIGFAEGLSRITKRQEGYVEVDPNWAVTSIAGDLNSVTRDVGRKEFLQDWIDAKNLMFSETNLNKIEAIYGKPTRDALENILYRMENGTNRTVGQDATVNKFLNWINGSVGAVMFFNTRSALLQTISTVNFINWEDNNMFKAAAAFANQPQFWKDFSYIFNSDMLKQRRSGLQIDVNYSELSAAYKDGRSKPEAVIRYLLEKGFLPTQIADSFAIAMGGSTFYRNRIKTYIKEGASQIEAEQQAWLDFQEVAEETQQSSRPDLISQQQAGVLGRLILAWQNTPMQMTRLTKKALSDLVNGRGSAKANISRIMYYGLIQNLIFGTLQTGLAFLMFGGSDEEEKKKMKTQRVLNGALDTLLRGTGIWGAAVATVKNTVMKFYEQREKGWSGDQTYTIIEAINLSPPLGSKFRKIYNAIQTDKFNKGVGKKLGFRIENPTLSIVGNLVEATTNFPMARLINKANNVEEAITGNHEMWQRMALLGGWNKWSLDIKDEELEAAKAEVKQDKIDLKNIEKENKKIEKKIENDKEKEKVEEQKKEDGIKQVRCSAIKSNGQRCNMMVETKKKTVKCVYHKSYTEKEKKEGTDRDNDGIKEFQCSGTTSSGKRCKNRTENTNKKCYAHQ